MSTLQSGLTSAEIGEIYAAANRESKFPNAVSLHLKRPTIVGLKPTVALLPHQESAVEWMHSREEVEDHRRSCEGNEGGIGGILADEPGLGKTLTTLACLLVGRAKSNGLPTLIVSPTPVIAAQWLSEVELFTQPGTLLVLHYTGPPTPYTEAAASELVTRLQTSDLVFQISLSKLK